MTCTVARASLRMAAFGVLAACAAEPALPHVDADAHRKSVDAWHEAQRAVLSERGAPLAYTGLTWLHAGSNTIGADSTNAIVLTGSGVPPRVGTVVREGNSARFEPANGTATTIDDRPATASPLRTDADSGNSSRLQVGSAGFRLIRRLDQIGVRQWDDERPAFRNFHAPHYFPDDVQWRIAGKFTPYAMKRTARVPTEAGIEEEIPVVGTVRTHVGGERYDLTAFEGDSAQDLWIVFKDATNGRESYGFRYLKAVRDTATNSVVLDFNYAYNPDCAYTPYATCPLAPAGNRIRARIASGEQEYDSAVTERK